MKKQAVYMLCSAVLSALAGPSVTLTAQLFGVLKTTILTIMSEYTKHGLICEEKKWSKIESEG